MGLIFESVISQWGTP